MSIFGVRFWRMILSSHFIKKDIHPNEPLIRTFKIGLFDLDFNNHVTNSKYFIFLDLLRIEFMIRMGGVKKIKNLGLRPVLATSFIRYRKELRWRDEITVSQEICYLDDGWFYFDCKFIKDDVVHCHALQKGGFYKPGEGMYPPEKMLDKFPDLTKPEMPDFVRNALTLEESIRLQNRNEKKPPD